QANALDLLRPSLACRRVDAITGTVPPFDQDGVRPGSRTLADVVRREVETTIVLHDAVGNRLSRRAGLHLAMEVDDRTRRGLAAVHHLSRDGKPSRGVTTTGHGGERRRRRQGQNRMPEHGLDLLFRRDRGRADRPSRGRIALRDKTRLYAFPMPKSVYIPDVM